MKRPAVYLIGAGPGDPGLITVQGLSCLSRADVVIYDHLVSPSLLRRARPDAELIDVGNASPGDMAQEAISYLLVEKAREDKVIARLKWGDPFVFDRTGEEALFLHEQGVPFEVVPGVPAGIAVPAYAGVPLTYHGGGDTVTLVRGYEDESRTPPDVDWGALAALGGTIVCYAGGHQLTGILEALLAHEWPAEDDAIVIYDGTLSTQQTVSGTLEEVAAVIRQQTRREPAILVVGRVVGFREHLRWFDARPLFGKRVLVTRPREQAAELVTLLGSYGAESVEAPMIRIMPPDDPGPLRQAASRPGDFDWIVFTSVNAVEAFMGALLDGERDLRALAGPKLCAVGASTAGQLARYGIKVDVVPEEFRAEAVVAALTARGPIAGARVLLPRSDIGREIIAHQLRGEGAQITEVVAYRTVLHESASEEGPDVYGLLLQGRIDVVTFTSASAVRNFVTIYGEQTADLLRTTTVAAIGPVTADAAAEFGITVNVRPETYTIPALVEAIVAHFNPS